MNKKIVINCAIIVSLLLAIPCLADTDPVQIKMGSHEKTINEKHGMPIAEERINKGFLPIAKKKALYKIDDENYFIVKYFSGRAKELDMLQGFDLSQARAEFQKVK